MISCIDLILILELRYLAIVDFCNIILRTQYTLMAFLLRESCYTSLTTFLYLLETLCRLDGLADMRIRAPMIVCNEDYHCVIAKQLRVIGKECHILLEPAGRNTALALMLVPNWPQCTTDWRFLVIHR